MSTPPLRLLAACLTYFYENLMQIETKTGASDAHRPAHQAEFSILIFGLDLINPTVVQLHDKTPIGSQIASAAGFTPDQQATVAQWGLKTLEDIGPNEHAKLSEGVRFIVVESDGYSRFTFDGSRYDWPAPSISVEVARKLAEIPATKSIFLERHDEPDILLSETDVISLSQQGVERLTSRALKWQLNVQGVVLNLFEPTIIVRDALSKAGLNPDQGWQIFLKVEGQPKQPLTLDSVVDLRTPGIEKLRVSPLDVGNGETSSNVMRSFRLLDVDEAFLDAHYPCWEAVVEGGRQWLLLPDYDLPDGYSSSKVCMALEIQPNYPAAQIDMFYLLPAAVLQTGAPITATEHRQDIRGLQFQRWSRHRGAGNQWSTSHDNVVTHLALVESCILKEAQQ
jgi:Prokaryotic E2 family E